jgi:hypothetical protein
MKHLLSVVGILLLFACRKNDYILIKHFTDRHHVVVAINEDKQNTNDFYLLRTFDTQGKLVHIKTQLKDIFGNTYVYDYKVSYGNNKLVLTGNITQNDWLLNDPEDLSSDPEVHYAGSQVIDTRSYEILLDPKIKFPLAVIFADGKRPLLKLSYDRRNYLDSLHLVVYNEKSVAYSLDYNVTTNAYGDIMSVRQNADPETVNKYGYLGVEYNYAEGAVGNKHEFYESPNILIDGMFNLLELIDIGPFQPTKRRTGGTIIWTYPPDEIDLDTRIDFEYRDHQYDAKGNLIHYTFDGEFGRFYYPGASHFGQRSRTLKWTDLGR